MKPFFHLQNVINNIKLKPKMIIIIFAVTILTGLCCIVCFQYVLSSYSNTLYEQTEDSLSYMANDISEPIQSISDLSGYILADPVMQQNLSQQYAQLEMIERNTMQQNIIKRLNTYYSYNQYMVSISIVNDNISITHGRSSSITSNKDFMQKLNLLAQQHPGKEFWVNSGCDDNSILCVRQILKIENLDLDSLALLIIQVDLKSIINDTLKIANADSSQPNIAILQGNDRIYPSKLTNTSFWDQIFSESQEGYKIVHNGKDALFSVSKTLTYPNWRYYLFVPYNQIFRSIIISTIFSVIIVVFLIGLIIWMASILVNNIIKHFDKLMTKMESFKSGVLDPIDVHYDYTNRQDELGQLHQNFDDMLVKLKTLVEDNYTKQILIKDAELKALQQQINPHFLYNTLESINWRAKASKVTEISVMVESLGNLLRSTISEKSDVIPLSKELDTVKSYVQIQQLRYDKRLVFTLQAEERLLKCTVPKMSIQPLIENAIKYGLERMYEPCSIHLTVCEQCESMIITVENNGSCIPPDILEQLHDGTLVPHGHGIGLSNIDARIKLLYGTQYGLSFASHADYSKVTILLPVAKGI